MTAERDTSRFVETPDRPPPRLTDSDRRPLICLSSRQHVVATLVLFLVSVTVLGAESLVAPFEADEADYVATSRYFRYLFLLGDGTREDWDSNHWTRTQPPLTRYIVGGWLTAHGYDLRTMNQPYVSTASSYEVNVMKGRVPTDDVLERSRQPMVLLAAGAVALLYPLGLLLGGPVAGLAAVSLALTSSFLRYTLVHTWAEAPLAFFLMLSVLLACLATRRLKSGASWLGWGVATGVALGLASATKLTGLVGVPLVGGVAAVLALQAHWLGDASSGRRQGLWAATVISTALAMFLVVNPYLWRYPITGLGDMIEYRRAEMVAQQQQWPEFAVLDASERPGLTAVGMTRIGPWGDLPIAAVPIGLGLAGLGLVAIRRVLTPRVLDPAALMLLVWLIGYVLAIIAGLGLSYPRYFLPASLLLLPFVGAGLAWAVRLAARRIWPHRD